jgi:ribonuclease D
MNLELPLPDLVVTESGLSRLLEEIEQAPEISVDTEGDSFFSYPDKVCLVQLTALEKDYLVDPLAGVDLSRLGRVMADPRKLKIFHDGEYDIASLKRDYRIEFKNLFDTRVAAAALGAANPGLASALEERFGIKLDKSLQRSEWSRRPLTEKQIKYAQLDTHYLKPLMEQQRPELVARGRMMIVEGECRRLERLVPPETAFDPDEFVRIKGARELEPIQRQVLRELFILREKLSVELGRPPFKVIGNESLVMLATGMPKSMFQLRRINGFSHGQIRRLGREVLDAVTRAREAGPIAKMPRLPNREGTSGFNDEETELHERLKQWRKIAATEMQIDSAYLVNRHVLLRIAKSRPKAIAALEKIDGIEPWQVERFGEAILGVVRGFEEDLREGKVQFRRFRGRQKAE